MPDERWGNGYCALKLVVVGFQAGPISPIGEHRCDQGEQGGSMGALRVQRIQKGPRVLTVTVEPVTDGRQHALLPVSEHVEHAASTVTRWIITIGFD